MNDDRLIADYIRDRYPEMLTTLDFAFYRIGHALRSFADNFAAGFKAATTLREEDEDNGTNNDLDMPCGRDSE